LKESVLELIMVWRDLHLFVLFAFKV
jgi:hypothetical protein